MPLAGIRWRMKTPRIWRLTSSSEGRSNMGACVRETLSVTLSHNALAVRRHPCNLESYPRFRERSHSRLRHPSDGSSCRLHDLQILCRRLALVGYFFVLNGLPLIEGAQAGLFNGR